MLEPLLQGRLSESLTNGAQSRLVLLSETEQALRMAVRKRDLVKTG